ncbi:MAG: heavy metal translocating P-type ATPase [Phycisphaerales bacterium]
MSAAVSISGASEARAAERVACSHCGLDVPAGLVCADRDEQFCCNGCEGVWRVLHGAGLGGFYDVREKSDAAPVRPKTSGESFSEFGDPLYQQTFVKPLPGGLAQTDFLLEGVHCAACVWLLERLPRVAPGVTAARVRFGSGTVSVTYRPDAIDLPSIARALDRLGYRPHPARGGEARDARTRSDRSHLIRVAVAGACAGNIMLVSIALYAGAFSGIAPVWESTFRWLSMGLGLLSLAWPGRVFFKGAMAALRTRTAHLDLPIALALLAGGLWGAANVVRGTGEIYFDSLSVLVFLLLVGRWIQHRQQRSASDSIELLLSLVPSSATLVDDDGTLRRVPIDVVEAGHLVEVRAGDTIPADGVVESGQSSVDASTLTGESLPREAGVGTSVAAGSTNLNAPLRVRVEAVGEHTRVGKLMARVSEAGARRAPIVRVTDRIAGWFVLAVLVLAAITFALWARSGVGLALDHATALLIVACPCGLGLAVPMAMGIATGRAARAGALIKDASSLQALAGRGVMLLDKTGTLTEGRVSLVAWHGDDALRGQLAALEHGSSHPVALALADEQSDARVTDRAHTPGGGVRGRVDGVPVAAGRPDFLESLGVAIDDAWWALADQAGSAGRTPVFVARDGRVEALAELSDALRPEVPASIRQIQVAGWDARVLSGDQQGVVDAVCGELGLPGAGGASPEDKAAEVSRIVDRGTPVAMVGDGVNDAAAMATATVGIAVHGGAEASLEAADVYLTKPGLEPVLDLLGRASGTMRTVRLCLIVSIAYNTSAAALAMAGLMSALFAAVLMPVSSLAVVAIALRAGRGGGRR